MKQSGIFALSLPGKLEEALVAADLTAQVDAEIETPIVFDNADAAVRAFLGGGPTALAIRHSGESAVASTCGLPSVLSLLRRGVSHFRAGTGSCWLE